MKIEFDSQANAYEIGAVMSSRCNDTDARIERIWIEKMRKLPGWRRMELASRLSTAARAMMMTGIRSRHPGESEEQLRRRFAEMHLGKALADKFFSARSRS